MVTIRQATLNDVSEIARIIVDSWRTTYAGIVPDDFLANLTYESREDQWRRNLSNTEHRAVAMVAENEAGQIIGVASGGQEIEGHPVYTSQLYLIYLRKEQQRAGVGRMLIQAIAKWLLESGFDSMLVWVLKDNPSYGFYERMGGQVVTEKYIEIGGANLVEVAYGWPDIRTLLETS